MAIDRSTSSDPPDERLDSWKEIARYLNRDESTAQRWERREGMPVHRHVHEKRGSVYAYRAELDRWWQGRRQQLEPPKRNGEGPASGAPQAGPLADSGREARSRQRQWWVGMAATLMLIPIGVLALKWVPRHWTPAPGSEPALVRLTSTSGLNTDPALSPDGSWLAYASDRGGAGDLDIWVQPVGGEQPTRVTSDAGDELEPSFSPSGDAIVFSKGESGGIYIVPTGGGKPRRLVEMARARTPRFSSDGRWVTYWTGIPVWVISAGGVSSAAPGSTGALFVVPADGGSPRMLARDFAHARYGTWSPKGEKLLFLGQRRHDANRSSLDWYIVGMDRGEPIRTGAIEVLRRAGVNGVPIPGAWTGDEGTVTFATYDDRPSNVWQLAVSPETARVDGEPVRLTFGTATERAPAVSPSGQVVFTSVTENVDVWRLPLDGTTGLAGGAIEPVTDNAAIDRLMNTSDDGTTMAFLSTRTGQDEAWIRDVPAGGDRRITYSGAEGARISRDGSMLAVGRRVAERPGVDLVPATGGPASPVCEGCMAGDWSPDGRSMVVRRGSPSRLLMRDFGSGRESELAAHPEWNLLQPRFSPDGRWIVFHTTNSPSLRQIYMIPAFPDGPVAVDAWIPIVSDFGIQPSWAPDGSGIYHFSLRDDAFCAWLQPLDPVTKRPVGSPRAVQHFHHTRLRAVAGAMVTNHVAAGYLYVTLTSSAGNIWMLDR